MFGFSFLIAHFYFDFCQNHVDVWLKPQVFLLNGTLDVPARITLLVTSIIVCFSKQQLIFVSTLFHSQSTLKLGAFSKNGNMGPFFAPEKVFG